MADLPGPVHLSGAASAGQIASLGQATAFRTRIETYFPPFAFQQAAEIQVYRGDDEDALKNILVGDFKIEGYTEGRGLQ